MLCEFKNVLYCLGFCFFFFKDGESPFFKHLSAADVNSSYDDDEKKKKKRTQSSRANLISRLLLATDGANWFQKSYPLAHDGDVRRGLG